MRKQKGSGLILLFAVLVMAITGSMLVLKLAPLYLDHYSVEKLLTGLKESAVELELNQASTLDLKDTLQSHFEAENLDHLYEFVDVKDLGLYKTVRIEYERRVELVSNIDIVATFEFDIEISE